MTDYIRLASIEDKDQIARLVERAHKEIPYYASKDLSPQKVDGFLQYVLRNNQGIVVVAESGDELKGVIVGLVQEYWFGFHKYATDVMLYTTPDAHPFTAVKLVKSFAQVAVTHDVLEIVTFVTDEILGDKHEKYQAVLEGIGFQHRGISMKYVGVDKDV